MEFALEQKKKKEADFDKIAHLEEEKQWKKISDMWELEEKARIDLLRSVYKEREEALLLKSKFEF